MSGGVTTDFPLRRWSDSSQVITEAGIYDAYGNLARDFPASSSPSFGYAGQHRYCTDATGLDYLKARYYDPTVGRFLSRDPIGHMGGLNTFAYVRDNPENRIDPAEPMSIVPMGYKGKITAALCREKCEEGAFNPTVCRAACKLLKNCSCAGLKSLIQHLLRHGQKQLAEALTYVYFALDCDVPNSCSIMGETPQ